ncbi:ATP-dependent DNA helicase PcrA [compost metagenome]
MLGIAAGIGKTTIQAIEDLAESSNVPMVAALKNFTSTRKQIMDALDSLRALLNELHRYYQLGKAVSDKPVSEMLEITLRKTNYRDNLLNKKDEESLARVENLDELLKVMEEYEASTEEPNMTEFLEGAALASGKDEESREQQVNLMTMHASKGLEFPVVFLVGWEQGIFPSQRAITPEDLEEERRLAYVGITRAESDVHISNARKRMMHRQLLFNAPSQFIDDIPREVLTKA